MNNQAKTDLKNLTFERHHPVILIHARGRHSTKDVEFWNSVNEAFQKLGSKLLLVCHHRPTIEPDYIWILTPNGLRAAGENEFANEKFTNWSVDHEALLDLEKKWRGNSRSTRDDLLRRKGLTWFELYYANLLLAARPSVVVIWNGLHPQELILKRLAQSAQIPILFMERAPFAGMVHLDTKGVLGGSTPAHQSLDELKGKLQDTQLIFWINAFLKKRRSLGEAKTTWWSQGNVITSSRVSRNTIGVRPGQKVILFAEQVTNDAQTIFYSPRFISSFDALSWLMGEQLTSTDYFFLVKAHPKSKRDDRDRMAQLVEGRGRFLDDIHISDAIGLSDYVAAINSTVLFEALMAEKPALMLGKSILSGKEVAYELGANSDREVVRAWLGCDDLGQRLENFRLVSAYWLSTCFFDFSSSNDGSGSRGPEEFAALVHSHATCSVPSFDKMLQMEADVFRLSLLCMEDYHQRLVALRRKKRFQISSLARRYLSIFF
jgi:hypothetical protein